MLKETQKQKPPLAQTWEKTQIQTAQSSQLAEREAKALQAKEGALVTKPPCTQKMTMHKWFWLVGYTRCDRYSQRPYLHPLI